jgi:antitoxin VapB
MPPAYGRTRIKELVLPLSRRWTMCLESGMALSIKTDEADTLARRLAELTDESLTTAVTVALRERLDRVERARADLIDARLQRLAVEYAGHDVTDRRSAEEILGYDEAGLPA